MVYHTDDGGDNGDNIREVHTNSKDHCQDGLELIFNEYLPFPYKSGFKIFVRAPKVPFFRTLTWALLAKKGPKNGNLGAGTKILRPLLEAKMMELPLFLSVYHFWMGFEPFFNPIHPGVFGSKFTRGADLPPPSKNGCKGWDVQKLSWNLISYQD